MEEKKLEIPQEFLNKTKEELYKDIVNLSLYIKRLQGQIEDAKAHMHLKNGEIVKRRTNEFNLKSQVGHRNMRILDLENQRKNVIDLEPTSGSII